VAISPVTSTPIIQSDFLLKFYSQKINQYRGANNPTHISCVNKQTYYQIRLGKLGKVKQKDPSWNWQVHHTAALKETDIICILFNNQTNTKQLMNSKT